MNKRCVVLIGMFGIAAGLGLTPRPTSAADTTTDAARLDQLETRVKALEAIDADRVKELADLQAFLSILSRTALPIGSIIPYAGAWPPAGKDSLGQSWTEKSLGWVLCDGRPIPPDPDFAELRSALGGAQNLPDCRGYFIRALDSRGNGDSAKVDPDAPRAPGSRQGDLVKAHSHPATSNSTISPNPLTTHWREPGGSGGSEAPGREGLVEASRALDHMAVSTSTTIGNNADGGPETRPKNLAFNYIIRFKAP